MDIEKAVKKDFLRPESLAVILGLAGTPLKYDNFLGRVVIFVYNYLTLLKIIFLRLEK